MNRLGDININNTAGIYWYCYDQARNCLIWNGYIVVRATMRQFDEFVRSVIVEVEKEGCCIPTVYLNSGTSTLRCIIVTSFKIMTQASLWGK